MGGAVAQPIKTFRNSIGQPKDRNFFGTATLAEKKSANGDNLLTLAGQIKHP
jgi:hypothetical protein